MSALFEGKTKRLLQAAIVIVLAAALALPGVCAASGSGYGVYIGLDSYKKIKKEAKQDKIIVVEGQSLSEKQIKSLKKGGRRVYSYLNVGSIETYRSYYKKFKGSTLDVYENWPDEYWMDMSDTAWQEYISNTVGGKLAKKGMDGFFIDNCDVYYHYHNKKTYNGLVAVMKKLRKYKGDLIINGGDVFVTKLMKDKKLSLIDGVNQETVFSRIRDYENDKFDSQPKSEHQYFVSYLAEVKKNKKRVFLLEYTKDAKLKKKIKSFCKKKGYGYYISPSVKLNGSH